MPPEKGSFGFKRKFWRFDLKYDFQNNLLLSNEFPEGKIVERKHIARERNRKLISEVKINFKSKYGKLNCQICGFDFEKVYGEIGKDFVECHHTIPVSEMLDNHKTKIEHFIGMQKFWIIIRMKKLKKWVLRSKKFANPKIDLTEI